MALSSRERKWVIVIIGVCAMIATPLIGFQHLPDRIDPFLADYRDNCSSCHGENLEGGAEGTPLVGVELKHGDSVGDIRRSIAKGNPTKGMPSWSSIMDEGTISSLAMLIAEKRLGLDMEDVVSHAELSLPEAVLSSSLHDFRVELFADDIDPLPFSIAPMPDGRMLLTEKKRGVWIIDQRGNKVRLVEGTPEAAGEGIKVDDIEFGLGWLLDIALHPDYEQNGWVYLHYGDRKDSSSSLLPVSMNRVDRAHIRDGRWVDVETIWRADRGSYNSVAEVGAGGRVAFDDAGHVFISIGIKGTNIHDGIQDLRKPYGKIHRVNDDGTVPRDNPFVGAGGGKLPSIWTYGHRSPQGLEFNRITGELWGSEMGPRGGDEVNVLLPGRNYGWPLTSKGVNYDGSPVEYGKVLGISFDPEDIEQPVVDFSPAPAISSFVFYEGEAFPNWRGQIIIGSLKAAALYRLEIDAHRLVRKETLIRGLARIRDVEVGRGGLIYLLLEHKTGGKIVRLVPVSR